ncbi:MAG: TolC family protein [Sphingobacteriales bacterium]|nr:TolC family protein [Sphingobacteriales bacterium]
MRYLTSLLTLLLLSNTLVAQNIGLQECLQYARQNNVQLKQLGLNTDIAKINEKQSHQTRLPNLNGSFSYGGNLGRTVDPTTNSFQTQASQASQINLTSSLVLYNGGQFKRTIEQRGLELELAHLQTDDFANNLDLSILGAYLQILLSEEQLSVLQRQADLTQQQYRQMQKLVNAGSVPGGNLLDINAQIANDQLNQVNGQNAIDLAYTNLRQLLNRYDTFKIVRPTLPEPSANALSNYTPDEVYQNALSVQPSVKVAVLQTQIAEKRLAVTRTNQYPTVSLTGNFSTQYSSLAKQYGISGIEPTPILTNYFTQNFDSIYTFNPIISTKNIPVYKQWGDNLGGFLGLSAQFPIFNQYQVKNGISLAKLNIENTRLSQELTRNNIRQQIEQAYINAKGAAERYKATKANIEALKNNLSFVQKRYDLGLTNNLDYNTAKNNLTAAELNLESAKFDYFFRLKILDYYQGKPLDF